MKSLIAPIKRPIEPLPIIIRDRIVELIQDKIFSPGNRIPPEPELAARLGVSRGSLREALRLLEEDGFIYRKAGRGTFVRMSPPSIASRSLEKKFTALETIESIGLKPTVTDVESKTIAADCIMADILKVEEGSPLIFTQRVIKAGDRRAVFAMNILPQAIVKNKTLKGFKRSLRTLLEKECGQKIEYGIATLIPALADDYLAQKLRIDPGLPLLLIEQVEYDAHDTPVLLTREYWVKDVVEFTLFRDRRI